MTPAERPDDQTPVGLDAARPLDTGQPVRQPEGAESESVGTVVVAGAANLAIAVAKLVAGLISGSAAAKPTGD